jgi:hypothetical protein
VEEEETEDVEEERVDVVEETEPEELTTERVQTLMREESLHWTGSIEGMRRRDWPLMG